MLVLFSFLRGSPARMASSKVFMTSSVTSACNVSGFSLSWKRRWSLKPGDYAIVPSGHTVHWPAKLRRLSPLSSSSNLLKLSFRLGIKTEACQPRKKPENAATPTCWVHALLVRFLPCNQLFLIFEINTITLYCLLPRYQVFHDSTDQVAENRLLSLPLRPFLQA